MQSFLQYRRFKGAVEAQLERDRERARVASGQHGCEESVTAGGSTSDKEKRELERDVEKGDFARRPPGGGSRDLGAKRTEDQESNMENEQRAGSQEPAEQPMVPEAAEEEEDEEEEDDFEIQGMNRRLSRITTQQSAGVALGNVLTGIQVRKRNTIEGGAGQVFVVGYEGPDDPNDPHNWPMTTRIACTFMIASIGCVVGLASAIDSSALAPAAREFHVAEVVESMATGLYLVGFGLGAVFAGPISETVGRNPVYIVTLAIYMIWVMASALSPNIGAQLVFRFLAGFFGSTPLTCAGGSISDLWSPLERVFAFPVFANAAFTGPLLGPIMGGYIVQYLDWRWVDWITLIFSGLVLGLVFFLQPETYPQALLKWKAAHLRAITGDDRYRAAIEIRQETFLHRLKRALYRPFLLTAQEPIIILLTLYLSVIYIILFTFLDGYPYIFQQTYGISEGLTGICFVGIIIGLFGASALVPLIYKWAKRDLQKIQEAGGDRLPPEFRLWFSMLGGSISIPVSLFWMGWTAQPQISIWSPLAASVLFGYGILCVFITCYQYIIDCYETFAASALASLTLIRYLAAGGMAIVGVPFYENMGVQYTLTILACISVPLVPVPYVFYRYGPWIRSKSKYAIRTTTGKE
ncbi:MFS general substrate transporter [Lecanosticta acicola]|uniref:Cercosporin MFS transporter CTB4 n=1 Tax=Lecanosticta acicola TaxID=111012 RepID=A0AAI9E995_9PEZI|nr:MFS general substrate transporter [Lecanosticta acicola]